MKTIIKVLTWLIDGAPIGYEDETGFHHGTPPTYTPDGSMLRCGDGGQPKPVYGLHPVFYWLAGIGLLFALIGGCHPAHATEIQPDMTPVALPEPSNAVSVLVMLVFAVATCVAAKRLSAHKRKGDQWEHTNQRTKA